MNTRRPEVYVVDDDEMMRWSLPEELGARGFQVRAYESGEDALRGIPREGQGVVLLDVRLPGMDGLEVLDRLRTDAPRQVVLVITGHPDVGLAVEAMRRGARDFITKPYHTDDVVLRIERALEQVAMEEEVRMYRAEKRRTHTVDEFGCADPAMRRVLDTVAKIAASRTPLVLLLGESGTGKGVLASLIHQLSDRRDSPFLELNCAALPESLLESEVFGHEKGAFTSALAMKKGLFELAHGGTLFLDEIGDLPPSMQAKVLSFLETRRFRRIGGVAELEVDVRIVTATNKDLKNLVQAGTFRDDLYYRLSTFPVPIPPLRNRPADIAALTGRFFQEANQFHGKAMRGIHPTAMAALERHGWPGNVRELKSAIDRAVLLAAGDMLMPEDLPEDVNRSPGAPALRFLEPDGFPEDGIALAEAERRLIELALRKSGGNQSNAARLLRIQRDALRYRMKKYGML